MEGSECSPPLFMIISGKAENGLIEGVEHKGDNTVFHHVEDVRGVLKEAHEIRENSDNGFTKNREMRQIGLIPMSIMLEHPEWSSNPNLIKKWLNTDEGRMFRTVRGRV